MKALLSVLFIALLLPFTFPQAKEKPPTVKEVKAAIQSLMKAPEKAKDSDLAIVMRFAELSEACWIEAPRGLVANPSRSREFRLMLSYFVAGSVLYDLDNPRQMKDPNADKVAAIKAELLVYRAIQKSNKGFKDSVLDNLAKLEKEGKLQAHIKKVMAESAKPK